MNKMEDINLIRKLAWKVHYSSGFDCDELFQEAALAYLEALKTYDPQRGKITTYMHWVIISRLRNFLRREMEFSSPLCDLKEARKEIREDPHFWELFPQSLDKVTDIIINTIEIIDFNNASSARKEVRKILFKNGFTLPEVREILRQLKTVFS